MKQGAPPTEPSPRISPSVSPQPMRQQCGGPRRARPAMKTRGLQNRQAVVARRLEGSIPSPLRLAPPLGFRRLAVLRGGGRVSGVRAYVSRICPESRGLCSRSPATSSASTAGADHSGTPSTRPPSSEPACARCASTICATPSGHSPFGVPRCRRSRRGGVTRACRRRCGTAITTTAAMKHGCSPRRSASSNLRPRPHAPRRDTWPLCIGGAADSS
jgi:hypothetical protein